MRTSRYPVTTIGDPELGELGGEAAPLEGELLDPKPCCTACGAKKPSMHGLEDLTILYNPLAWAAQKLIDAGISHVTGKDGSTENPGAADQLANALGIDPVEVAIELTGFSGIGRYWPAMKLIGGATAIGGAAYLAARAIQARRKPKRKSKRG